MRAAAADVQQKADRSLAVVDQLSAKAGEVTAAAGARVDQRVLEEREERVAS